MDLSKAYPCSLVSFSAGGTPFSLSLSTFFEKLFFFFLSF